MFLQEELKAAVKTKAASKSEVIAVYKETVEYGSNFIQALLNIFDMLSKVQLELFQEKFSFENGIIRGL